jgi:hypothetical protein
MESKVAKSDPSGGAKPSVHTTHLVIGDQQTVSHLKGPLGIPGKLEKQMTVAHLTQPLGAKPGGNNSQPSPAPKPAPTNQGSQGGNKK